MGYFFFILLMGALLAVVASLFVGLFAMARGRESDAKLSSRAMRWRVGLQAFALVCFILAFLTARP